MQVRVITCAPADCPSCRADEQRLTVFDLRQEGEGGGGGVIMQPMLFLLILLPQAHQLDRRNCKKRQETRKKHAGSTLGHNRLLLLAINAKR